MYSGCFSATTCACTRYLSVRNSRDRVAKPFECDGFLSYLQDFATQVHFWTLYREQCDLLGIPYGKHVTPHLGEHFSGQIPNAFN